MAKVKTFMPSIHTESSKARQVFFKMRDHRDSLGNPDQGRSECIWNETLAKCAEARIKSMADLGWSGHTDPWGKGANWWARAYGYVLPDWYDNSSNNIESLNRGGWGNVDNAMRSWLNSPGHTRHVLGQSEFFAAQTQIGVAYLHQEDSIYKHYWCILSAPPITP